MSYKFKHFMVAIHVLLVAALVTGCWNNRDLTEMTFAIGAGFDMLEDGGIQMTVQIVKPSAMKSSEGLQENQNAVTTVSVVGNTVFECIRNFISKTNRRIYWGHVQLMVIGESVAKNGIDDVVDLFERDQETRRRADVVIAKNNTAKAILEAKSELDKLPAVHIAESLKSYKANGKTQDISLFEVIERISNPDYGYVIGTIESQPQVADGNISDMNVEGSAVFEGDRIKGYLDPLQTRGFLFAENKIKTAIINIDNPKGKGESVAIEILRSEGKIKVSFDNDTPVLGIEVAAEGNIGQQEGGGDLTTPDMTEILVKETEDRIKGEIEETLHLMQKKYESDIYGFSDKIYKDHYKQWNNLKNNWKAVFRDAPTEVKVKFSMRRPGLIKNPAYGE